MSPCKWPGCTGDAARAWSGWVRGLPRAGVESLSLGVPVDSEAPRWCSDPGGDGAGLSDELDGHGETAPPDRSGVLWLDELLDGDRAGNWLSGVLTFKLARADAGCGAGTAGAGRAAEHGDSILLALDNTSPLWSWGAATAAAAAAGLLGLLVVAALVGLAGRVPSRCNDDWLRLIVKVASPCMCTGDQACSESGVGSGDSCDESVLAGRPPRAGVR